MYEKRKDEEIIAPHFSYCKQRKNQNEGHHKYYFLHTLNSKIKSLNKIQLL